ncbi:MAG: hypothetical protein VZR95_01215 [Alphaproteobacteria bacterium]
MLVFAFFAAVFSSVSWLIYAVMFVNTKLMDENLWEQSSQDMLLFLSVVFLPILVIWSVFGYVNQFLVNRGMSRKQNELLKQLQKNQDYTDLVVRVMLDAEHEIKDGFVLNKFDVFINDMNEALGEVIQRCNIASSAQVDQLWQRVRRGEKWALGKAVLDASKNQSTFDAWVREKVGRDKVFRGSLLEFCSRYQNLMQLLEKHDRDRVFLNMIETGVFGKVYSIIAPLSENASQLRAEVKEKPLVSKEKAQDYASVLKIATIQEPKADETIINVDKDDDENEEVSEPRQSFFSRLNPFRRKNDEADDDVEEQDPFFQALQNSFQDKDDLTVDDNNGTPFSGLSTAAPEKTEPSLGESRISEPVLNSGSTFGSAEDTLASLRAYKSSVSAATPTEPHLSSVANRSDDEPSLRAEKTPDTKDDNEDLVYPFGGWTDESKYNK